METKEQKAARNKAYYNANKSKILAHKSRNSERINAVRRVRLGMVTRAEYLASLPPVCPIHKKAVAKCYNAQRNSIRNKNPKAFSKLLGCTSEDFKNHLQKKFQPGWSFENYSTAWECDHIIPLSKFDLKDPSQLAKAGHFSNIQPLAPDANRKKWKF